ncbi:hypothetical protein ACIQB5_51015 [Streptomyces sp. NPDC088560]|uniref:hypothetical protein n=1 Tax=Streptomyces sp. NPDC088560 TaxID=3365868 RepID=UPI00381F470C
MRRLVPAVSPQGHLAEVPIAWLSAQDSASRLLDETGACWPAASFEHRAVHDVLALTLLFAARFEAPSDSCEDLGLLQALVADDVEWAVWCQGRLGLADSDLSRSDRERAERTFRWLTDTRLVAGSLSDTLGVCALSAPFRGAGVSVGVALAQRVLDLWAHRFRPWPGTG